MSRPLLPLAVALLVAAAVCVARYYTIGITNEVVRRFPDSPTESFLVGAVLPLLFVGAGASLLWAGLRSR
jgi:hypothetical protein